MSDDSTNAGAMSDGVAATSVSQGISADSVDSVDSGDGVSSSSSSVTSDQMGDVESSASPLARALPPRPLASVEKMEVEVDFEVGRVTLAVSALANIAQGAVVEVGSLSLDDVVAKSGGVAFARGEFVELGGRVGFRITKLFGEPAKL